jgi:diguanylate cyclase (GGDEF)-like protein
LWILSLLMLLLLCSLLPGRAGAASAAAPAASIAGVGLIPQADLRGIAPQLQVLEDPQGSLDTAAVLRRQHGWTQPGGDALRLGPSRSAFWLRVRLVNRGDGAGDFVLALGSVRQDHVRWVVVDPATGRIEQERDTGERAARSTRPLDAQEMALPLRLAAGQERDVYVRVRSHDGLMEPMAVEAGGMLAFQDRARLRLALLTLYSGALLALLLYNLFLFVSTRGPEFAAYVTYAAGLLLWNLAYNGIGSEWIWRDQPILNHQLPLIGGALAHAGAWWFVPTYLRLHERPELRRTMWAYRVAACLHLINIPLALADYYTLSTNIAFWVGTPMLLFTPFVAWRVARLGQREGIFLAVAFIAPVPALLLFYAQLFGLLPMTEWGRFSIQIGSFIEMVLLAFGLADSMNALKAQKLAAERALAQSLERKVAERTRDLEAANRRLCELAVTDELTGVFNRRRFNEDCAARLCDGVALSPFALAMFDLDHFKRYNDCYGHQAGDRVLQQVAQFAAAALQGQGQLYRLGGEEFAALFNADSTDQALVVTQRLLASIRALNLPHGGNPAGRVTASFGVQWCERGRAANLDPDQLYANADQALYEAKAQGRDRAVVQRRTDPADTRTAAPAGTAA